MPKICEDFYSIQGEGISSGFPSYFIRLSGCSLSCGGKLGKWLKEGRSTWVCDSQKVISNYDSKSNMYILDRWVELGIIDSILEGDIHVIWTGGEPTLKESQEDIISFIDYVDDCYPNNKIFYEIETNGTRLIDEKIFNRIDQINCSPKLANSGNQEKDRIKLEVIDQINQHPNSWFKVVISSMEDVSEFIKDFVISCPSNIPFSKIILMPALDNQEKYFEGVKLVYELAKIYKCKATARNHIAAWNKLTGV